MMKELIKQKRIMMKEERLNKNNLAFDFKMFESTTVIFSFITIQQVETVN